jgi:hypothetical protein
MLSAVTTQEGTMRLFSIGAAALLLAGPLAAWAGPTAKPAPAPAAGAPEGFVEMAVQGLMPTENGTAVVLRLEKEGVLLPIWIGEAEAFSIQLRLERRRFERPLTHDLLDAMVKELGGQLVKVQVDDLKGGTFVGTVFLRQDKRLIPIDARPSDAIALAIGNRVPIFVSRKVIDSAGIKQDDAERPPSKGTPGDQEKLLKDIIESGGEEKTL